MAKKKKAEVVELPVAEQEVSEQTDQEQLPVKCEIIVGIREDGDVYFGSKGSSVDLITIEGLLSYARQELDRIWEVRAIQQAQAMAQAEASGDNE